MVKPTAETAVGSINADAFTRSVDLLLQVGLIKNAVSFEDIVDTSIYDAIAGQ
jgi:hypothetical protein